MKEWTIVAVLAVGMVVAVAAFGDGQATAGTEGGKAVKKQTTCPVMGGEVDKSLYTDVEGKRIYVCCKGCIAAVKKDPAKYIKALEDAGVTIEAVPAEPAKSAGDGKK